MFRHCSSDDVSALAEEDYLTVEQMEIDTELCGQLLIARRRELQIEALIATLEVSNHVFKLSFVFTQFAAARLWLDFSLQCLLFFARLFVTLLLRF